MKIIEKIEKFGLRNITGISIFLIISILLLDLIPYFFLNKINLLSTTNTLTFIGAIFAFWYGYKKYERDKELEIIEKYSSKYNEIKNSILTEDNKVKYKKDLINLFYEEYYLYSKKYISEELWHERKEWIYIDFFNILKGDTEKVLNEKQKVEFDSTSIISTFLQANSLMIVDGKNFNNFLMDIIQDYIINNKLNIEYINSGKHPLYTDKKDKINAAKECLNYVQYAEVLLDYYKKLEKTTLDIEINKMSVKTKNYKNTFKT